MRKLWLIFILATFLSPASHLFAQEALREGPPFPFTWIGKWEGDLNIYGPAGLLQSVPMSLTILPLENGSYTWNIQYGPDSSGLRPYLLEPVAPEQGRYRVNENNGILLNEQLLGDKLYSLFSVEGSLLLSTVEKVGENLVYEIIASGDEPGSTTGGGVHEGEPIPAVGVYNVMVRQVAILKRR
jgi:hypothetical protein